MHGLRNFQQGHIFSLATFALDFYSHWAKLEVEMRIPCSLIALVGACIVLSGSRLGLADSFLEDLQHLQELHRTRIETELNAMEISARSIALEQMIETGLGVGVLSVDRHQLGSLRSLSGLDVQLPSRASSEPTEAAIQFIERFTGLFAIEHPREVFSVRKTATTDNGFKVFLDQHREGLRVFGARAILHLTADGSISRFNGIYLPEKLLPSDVNPMNVSVAHSLPGIFHGTLFGMSGWESRQGVPAYKTFHVDDSGASVFRFTSALDGHHLHVIPADTHHAPSDSYHSPDGQAWPGAPVRLDSTSVCGTGTYPACSYPGTSLPVWFWTSTFGTYLADRFNRDSWDNNQDPPDCIGTFPDNHPLKTTSDYNPGNVQNRAFWSAGFCNATFGSQLGNCFDVIGHEFGHGIQQADMDITPLGCQHSSAIFEGLADVIGEFFDGWISPTTEPDWLMGTGTNCVPLRDLANPYSFYQPDHASNYNPSSLNYCMCGQFCGDHFNSTIISKAAHLLGRPPTSGSVSHWGISVTGIGGVDASRIFYGAIQDLSPNPTFSDVREGLLYSAKDQFGIGSNQYNRTLATVNAMGYWTKRTNYGFTSPNPPSAVTFAVNGVLREYIFYYLNGAIRFRYRDCPYDGICTWSSQMNLHSADSGASAVVFQGAIWVFFDYQNGIRYKRILSDGSITLPSIVPSATTASPPVAVQATPDVLHLFFRDNVPLLTSATVRMKKRVGGTWQTTVATPISSRTTISAVSAFEGTHVAYTNADRRAAIRMYSESSDTWSNERDLQYPESTPAGHPIGPSIALYMLRLHVTFMSSNLTSTSQKIASCIWPCGDGQDPTLLTSVDGVSDRGWGYLFVSDNRLFRTDLVNATGMDPEWMSWRWKKSR